MKQMKDNIGRWLNFSAGQRGIQGFMYTTWTRNYKNLKPYFDLLDGSDKWMLKQKRGPKSGEP